MILIKHVTRYGLLTFVVFLSACSTAYDEYVYQRPQSNLPVIPEIASARVVPQPRYIPPPVEKVYQPKVHKYTPSKATNTVITQKEVASVIEEQEEQEQEEEAKKSAEVEIDPYAEIPENGPVPEPVVSESTDKTTSPKPMLGTIKPPKQASVPLESSSAVKTLLLKARADLATGRTSAAIDKLERGLRIEPQNSDLWYQLANAQYDQDNYTQAITMAKKSIRYTNRDYMIAKNWMLIKQAGLKSGDTVVVKEAIDYFKINL